MGRISDLELIYNIIQKMQKANNLHELIDEGMHQVVHFAEAEAGTLWFFDEQQELMPYIMVGPYSEKLADVRLKSGEGIAGRVFKQEKAEIVVDVRKDSDWKSSVDKITKATTRSILCVPIKTNQKCYGCIQLINKLNEKIFNDEELKICEDIASVIAFNIESKGFIINDKGQREIILSVRNVSKTYQVGEVVINALNNVSMDIYKGEFLVILGASGSGKSTLLNMIGGMDKPTGGNIFVGDKNITAANEKELTLYRKNDVGFVFQFYNLLPDLTAQENISFVAALSEDTIDIEEILEEVQLTRRKNNFPSQMSGGEQQRVSIARAIIKKPRMLLCDEPTGALDYKTGKIIVSLLKRICEKYNTAVTVVTHNNAFALVADRVVKMRSGEIVEVVKNANPLSVEEVDW